MKLILSPHFHDTAQAGPYGHMAADAFYAELLQTHEGLSAPQSALLDARLVLLLANHIGNLSVLRAALQAACEGITPTDVPMRTADAGCERSGRASASR
ncbi:MAG: DUF2783 domain-containing protein [Thiomonas sp.]